MALFLSESVGHTVELISIEEALVELHSIAMEGEVLTESLLRADFIIHEQSRELSEAAQVDKKMGFFAKAWEAIKAFCKKVWNVIKRVCKAVWEKLKMVWNKISGNKGNVKKPKKAIEVARLKLALAEEMAVATERTYASKEDFDRAVQDIETKYERKIADAAKLTGTVEITKDELGKLFGEAEKVAKAVEKAADATDKEVAKVDGDVKAGKPEAQAQAGVVKAKQTKNQKAAASAAAAASALAGGQSDAEAGA